MVFRRIWRLLRAILHIAIITILAGCAGAVLSGCAGTTGPGLEAAAQAGAEQPETDCGRITGRVQIRILSLRSSGMRSQTTSLSRGLNSVTSAVGMSEGQVEAPDSRQARELAELQEMNARLKTLGCKSFDLDAALKDTNGGTPKPTL